MGEEDRNALLVADAAMLALFMAACRAAGEPNYMAAAQIMLRQWKASPEYQEASRV